jgi:hypothetical protein
VEAFQMVESTSDNYKELLLGFPCTNDMDGRNDRFHPQK